MRVQIASKELASRLAAMVGAHQTAQVYATLHLAETQQSYVIAAGSTRPPIIGEELLQAIARELDIVTRPFAEQILDRALMLLTQEEKPDVHLRI